MTGKTVWKQKMVFTGEVSGHAVLMDTKSPIGNDSALTPKELVALGLVGCTAMDVVALMKKYKQTIETFEVLSDVTPTTGVQPSVFKDVKLIFRMTGQVDKEKYLEAVKLSQTKFCGVSAMLSKAVPISYTVELNGQEVGRGEADFG